MLIKVIPFTLYYMYRDKKNTNIWYLITLLDLLHLFLILLIIF